jgi:hypothetical protein
VTISQPRIEVKEAAAAAGWFGAREEAKLPARADATGPGAATAGAHSSGARGAFRNTWPRRVRRALFDLAIVIAALTAVPVLTVSIAHGEFWSRWKTFYTQPIVPPAGALQAFVAPSDPAITPLAAGESYVALFSQQTAANFPGPNVNHSNQLWSQPALPSTMIRPDGAGRGHTLSGAQMLEAAARGFSVEELAYLRELSTAPFWRDFDRVARAPAADVIAWRFQLPFLPSATVFTMPAMGIMGFRGEAELAVRRAAYHLAIGQRDSAEAVLRLIVSFGVRVMQNATTLNEQVIGGSVVGIGMDGLEQFYEITRDPRASAVRAAMPAFPSRSATENGSVPGRDAFTVEQVRSDLIRRAGDPRELRGTRFTSLQLLSVTSCTNARELLFGPRADVRDAFERAKHDLARYPSEQALIELIQRTPNSSSLFGEPVSPARQFLVGVSTIAGAVLHNPRLVGCTLIATEGRLNY